MGGGDRVACKEWPHNQGAGSSIGGRLRKYCNGTRFKVAPFGRRTRTAVIVVALRNGKQVHQVIRRR
jgi:hypothetical protein